MSLNNNNNHSDSRHSGRYCNDYNNVPPQISMNAATGSIPYSSNMNNSITNPNNRSSPNNSHSYNTNNTVVNGVDLSPEEMNEIFGFVSDSVSTAAIASVPPGVVFNSLSHEDFNRLHDDGNTPTSMQNSHQANHHHIHHRTYIGDAHMGDHNFGEEEDEEEQLGTGGGGSSVGSNGDIGRKIDSTLLRTERKRSREKQRRHDVNKQFTDLTSTVRQIEADTEEYRVSTMYSPNNRADLIARTVALLQALHSLNEKKALEIQHLQDELQRSKQAGEETAAKLKESLMQPQHLGNNNVLMMVPMMMNHNDMMTSSTSTGGTISGAPSSAATTTPAAAAPAAMMMPMMVPSAVTTASTNGTTTNNTLQQQQQQPWATAAMMMNNPQQNGNNNHNHNNNNMMMMPWMQQMMMQQMMMMQPQSVLPHNMAPTAADALTGVATSGMNHGIPMIQPTMMAAAAATTTANTTTDVESGTPTGPFVLGRSSSNGTSPTSELLLNNNSNHNNNNEEQKVASSNSMNEVMGSNLAHCA
jgi:hypothetical protein